MPDSLRSGSALSCVLGIAAMLVVTACGGDSTTPLEGGQLILTAGDMTNRSSGFEHQEQVQVRLTDINGPVAGATITWTPSVSGDSVIGGEQTDADGRASATWYFGPGVGDHAVTVSTPGVESITFGIDVLGFKPDQMKVGLTFACGLFRFTDVYCLGKSSAGNEKTQIPTLVPGGWEFNTLDVEGHRACGGTSSNAMVCWESEAIFGSDPPSEIAGFPFTFEVATLTENVCGLAEAGVPWCGGVDYPSGPVEITGAPPLEHLVGGDDSFGGWVVCGLSQTDGSAWCWGSNAHSSSGSGTDGPSYDVAQQVSGATPYSDISASQTSVCAIQVDMHIACWGFGAAMPGSPGLNYAVPQVFDEQATEISAGWFGYYAATPTGPRLFGSFLANGEAEALLTSLPDVEAIDVGDIICVKQHELETSCSVGLTDDIMFDAWKRMLPLVTVPNPFLLP